MNENEIKDSKGFAALMRLIRPKQWIKNMFIFVPLFFGGALFHTDALLAGLIAFFAYSFAASSIYCFNDIHDVEADRRHSVKCHRPIASGAVSIRQAYALMFLMLILSMGVCSLLDSWETMGIIAFYWVMNLCYCAKLKQYAILITLFMSFAKRRDDVLRMEKTGEAPRKNTSRYNLTFINQAITITASVTLVCYIMYTVSPEVIENFHTEYLYLTSVFVLVGLLRYIQIAVVDQKSGDPTKIILRDRITQFIVLAWLLSFLFLIYIE